MQAEHNLTLPLPLPLTLTLTSSHVHGAAVVQAEHDLWSAVEAGDEVGGDLVVVAVGSGAKVAHLEQVVRVRVRVRVRGWGWGWGWG